MADCLTRYWPTHVVELTPMKRDRGISSVRTSTFSRSKIEARRLTRLASDVKLGELSEHNLHVWCCIVTNETPCIELVREN